MRRTRKWSYVAQEAARLADLGLSPIEIATRLEVRRHTVTRWMAAGKLTDTRRKGRRKVAVATGLSPGAWAASVRASYLLDASDDELVTNGEAALVLARDPTEKASVRLNAMRTFGGIVKQLALVARAAEAEPEPIEEVKTVEPARVITRPAVDPRTALRAVK